MTRTSSRLILWVWMLSLSIAAGGVRHVGGQERFSRGQNVAPVFEGWVKRSDGSFDFYFGYLNRNWAEEPIVAVGPDNSFSPGAIDRGQPTYFYPRRNEFVFTVNVPRDWGTTKELIWTLTVNGKTDRAYGWLKPEWEIDALLIARNPGNQGGRTPEEIFENRPPTITVDAIEPVKLPKTLKLTAFLTDDGLPVAQPRRRREGGLETLAAPPAPINVPTYRPPQMARNELSVRWMVYRGPASVVFDPPGYNVATGGEGKKSGRTATIARFTEPGTYVLRAIAADGVAFSTTDITVTVTKPGTQH